MIIRLEVQEKSLQNVSFSFLYIYSTLKNNGECIDVFSLNLLVQLNSKIIVRRGRCGGYYSFQIDEFKKPYLFIYAPGRRNFMSKEGVRGPFLNSKLYSLKNSLLYNCLLKQYIFSSFSIKCQLFLKGICFDCHSVVMPNFCFLVSSTWRLLFTKLMDWIEMKASSKKVLKFKDVLNKKIFCIARKLLIAMTLLGVVVCLLLFAVKYFGLRYDKHEFIHSEISKYFFSIFFMLSRKTQDLKKRNIGSYVACWKDGKQARFIRKKRIHFVFSNS